MRKPLLTAIAAFAMLITTALAADPTGTWLSQSGETKVRIAPCGGEFCGTIVWVANDAKDMHNPDPSLRERSLVGVQMIYGMQASGEGYAGRLYNYTNGKTYSGTLKTVGAGQLELAGCVMGMFCRRQTWTKAE